MIYAKITFNIINSNSLTTWLILNLKKAEDSLHFSITKFCLEKLLKWKTKFIYFSDFNKMKEILNRFSIVIWPFNIGSEFMSHRKFISLVYKSDKMLKTWQHRILLSGGVSVFLSILPVSTVLIYNFRFNESWIFSSFLSSPPNNK